MITTLSLATGPAIEPISLTDVKTHLRVDDDTEDAYIVTLIRAARRYIENITNRSLIVQTWDWFLDDFPASFFYDDLDRPTYNEGVLYVPRNPLVSVTHIKYTDGAGVLQTWAASNYEVDTDSTIGRIYPVYNGAWPSDVRNYTKAVEIQFIAGYADSGASPRNLSDNVPQELKHAIMLLIGHMFKHREMTEITSMNQVPWSVKDLISSYRDWSF